MATVRSVPCPRPGAGCRGEFWGPLQCWGADIGDLCFSVALGRGRPGHCMMGPGHSAPPPRCGRSPTAPACGSEKCCKCLTVPPLLSFQRGELFQAVVSAQKLATVREGVHVHKCICVCACTCVHVSIACVYARMYGSVGVCVCTCAHVCEHMSHKARAR